MNFLQTQEWGLMILDGKPSKDLVFVIKKICVLHIYDASFVFLYLEVHTIPAKQFRRVLTGTELRLINNLLLISLL